MLLRKNPNITTFVDSNAFGPDDKFDTSQDGFQIAVALDSEIGDVSEAARYFKFVARLYTQAGEKSYSKYYPLHPCSEEDYAKFYPTEKRSAVSVQRYRDNGGMFCLDWQAANLEMYGSWRVDSSY